MSMKKILAMLCVVALSVVSVVGTLAYLTDRSAVTNTFTVGNVDIKLDETVVNADGKPVDKNGNEITENFIREEEGNEYHLIPGGTYVKDPMVTVMKNSEESYVRMIVTINKASELKAIFNSEAGKNAYPNGFLPQDHVEGWDAAVWNCVSMTEDEDNNVVLEFRYHETVNTMDAAEDVALKPLFASFTFPGFVDGTQLATIADLEIKVEGHAIQAATFADADAAWVAFGQQWKQ